VTASTCHCTLTPEGALPAYHATYMVDAITAVNNTSNDMGIPFVRGTTFSGDSEESSYKYNTYV